ncbi:hypothetical protein EXIGLDRAFT_733058 [Exidia glandulosa HHB12029]|uniref:Uncharacterized protein n=1 Tax=Exidia glandulosa HHB12029 TaxID=1314781 RepID=A0A165BDR3_EXIGL|nr:hypothetical protein EXIGLDRAFT_733058 [Exidia glandulosa HHB12029]
MRYFRRLPTVVRIAVVSTLEAFAFGWRYCACSISGSIPDSHSRCASSRFGRLCATTRLSSLSVSTCFGSRLPSDPVRLHHPVF